MEYRGEKFRQRTFSWSLRPLPPVYMQIYTQNQNSLLF